MDSRDIFQSHDNCVPKVINARGFQSYALVHVEKWLSIGVIHQLNVAIYV